MKKFLFWTTLIVAAVVALLYLLGSSQPGAYTTPAKWLNSYLRPTTGTVDNVNGGGFPIATGINDLLGEAKDTIASGTAAAKNSIAQSISSILDDIASSTKGKAADFLGVDAVSTDSSSYGSTSANPSSNGAVCTAYKKGSAIGYVVNNPFSPPQDFVFRVDWGDGQFSNGNGQADGQKIPLSHSYDSTGDYITTFVFTGNNQSTTIQRMVCVN
jgi:hypothetical protein